MKTFIQNKLIRAFTMIELVFVIVIVGILSVMIAPSFEGNKTREAADQVVSHIRYTQHLAMMDNKFDTNDATWYTERWHISFAVDPGTTTNQVYWIMSDRDQSNTLTDPDDYATNPLDPTKRLTGDTGAAAFQTPELDLTDEYGITTVTNTCATNTGRIFFDQQGRPYGDTTYPATAPYQNIIQAPCTITLSNGTDSEVIELQPETGYVRVR